MIVFQSMQPLNEFSTWITTAKNKHGINRHKNISEPCTIFFHVPPVSYNSIRMWLDRIISGLFFTASQW